MRGRFELDTEVQALEARPNGWRIRASSTMHPNLPRAPQSTTADAETVLIAAGAWSREILAPLGIDVPLTAVGFS